MGGSVPVDAQEKAFAGLSQFPMDKNSADFMKSGTIRNSTLPDDLSKHTNITGEKLKEIQQKKGAMFLAIQISFFDDKTDDVWSAERGLSRCPRLVYM